MIEGIIIGVISSFIFLLISLIIKDWLWPKYKASIYQGTRLDGDWKVFYNNETTHSGIIKFTQNGINIIGESALDKNRRGESIERRYKYTGKILRNSIIFTFEDINNPLTNGGTMVLDFSDSDSKTIKGKSIYYKPELNSIDTTEVTLEYKPS